MGVNSVAELVGLGATLAIDYLIIARLTGQSILGLLVSILLVTATGAIEGSIVGTLQWAVLHQPFPSITQRSWVLATVIVAIALLLAGALVGAVHGLALVALAKRPLAQPGSQ